MENRAIPIPDVVPYAPAGVVKCLSNIPWNSTYMHVRDFANVAEQTAYMNSKATRTITGCTPVRLQNKIRIPRNAQELYNCNYLMWQNSNFGDKWFYGFISAIDYVNTTMCEVTFEIDVYQTWLFETIINPCYVEREMVTDDSVGANLVPDNLDTGTMITEIPHGTGHFSGTPWIVVASAVTSTGEATTGQLYGNYYTAVQLYQFSSTNVTSVNEFISNLVSQGKQDGILAIYMVPSDFTPTASEPVRQYEVKAFKKYDQLDGYVPKNNKLFTYPYNYLYVTNLEGNTAEYRFEFFRDADCTFKLSGSAMPTSEYVLYPTGYKCPSGFKNLNEMITMSAEPQCCFVNDAFKAWLAQNKSSVALSALAGATSIVKGGVQVAGGNVIGGAEEAMKGGSALAKVGAQIQHQMAQPPQSHGNINGDTIYMQGDKDFHFYYTHVTAEFAKIIDDFWSMYGYPVHNVKTPNTRNRPSWNYVELRNSCLTGNVPLNHLDALSSIYNRGVTIWHGDWIGQYDRANK